MMGAIAFSYYDDHVVPLRQGQPSIQELLERGIESEASVPYEEQFIDAPSVTTDGRLVRLLGVEHDAPALSRTGRHVLAAITAADVVVLERGATPAMGISIISPNDYFSQLAAWALSHGKRVFFIDTRSDILRAFGEASPAIGIVLALSVVLSILQCVLRKDCPIRPARKFVWLLVALILNMLGDMNPLIEISLIGQQFPTYPPKVARFDVSYGIDGFSVRMDKAIDLALSSSDAQIPLVIVGNFHAKMHEAYRREYPMLGKFKWLAYGVVFGLLEQAPSEIKLHINAVSKGIELQMRPAS